LVKIGQQITSYYCPQTPDGRTDGRTDGRMDGWTDGRTDGRLRDFIVCPMHMHMHWTDNNTRTYVDVLDELVRQYNNTIHSSIKMTPAQASLKKNENKVWINLYGVSPEGKIKPRFKVGDRVRITKKKSIFEKGYTPRWMEEVFTISAVQYTRPVTYKIKDLNDEKIQGTFYEPELQRTQQEIFRIEKVIRRRGDKSLVKWLGYPEEFNSWVGNKDLMKL